MANRYKVLGTNLVCPRCKRHIPQWRLPTESINSLKWGFAEVKCPGCYQGFHIEDGPLNALSIYPMANYISFPYSIGSAHFLWETEVNVGTTAIEDVMLPELIEKPLFERAVSVHDDPRRIREIGEGDYRVYRTPTAFDGVSVTLGIVPADGKIHIMTSVDESDDEAPVEPGDAYRVGYEVGIQVAPVQDPPWLEYLAEAADSIIRSRRYGAFPLLVSAFENHLYRQIEKTLRAKGESELEVDDWFDSYRDKRDHLLWKSVARDGLKKLTGTDIGSSGNPHVKTYQRYCSLKDDRDDGVVHVSYPDSAKQLQPSDVRNRFDSTVDLIVAVYDLCKEERSKQTSTT